MIKSIFTITLCTIISFDIYKLVNNKIITDSQSCKPKSSINDNMLSETNNNRYYSSQNNLQDNTSKPKERPKYISID